jgi:hypothetical protein
MGSRFAVLVLPALVAGVLVAPPLQASPPVQAVAAASVSPPCQPGAEIRLDIAAAAKVIALPAKGKKPRPVGQARVRALAKTLRAHPNPCTDPLDEYGQSIVDDIDRVAASGDVAEALRMMSDFMSDSDGFDEGEDVYDEGERVATLSSLRPRGASCGALQDDGSLTPPADIGTALKLAGMAQLLGDEGRSEKLIAWAQQMTRDWVRGYRERADLSLKESLKIAGIAQAMGLDDGVADEFLDRARDRAAEAYELYKVAPCRATKQTLECFVTAAILVELLGGDQISDAQVRGDTAAAAETALKLKAGRQPRCEAERYAFRQKSEIETDTGEFLTLDTGRVIVTIKDGKVTSANTGPLILSSVGPVPCWAQSDDGVWYQDGSATITGGRFPYVVSGRERPTYLTLRLVHQGRWQVSGGGSAACDFLVLLGGGFLNVAPELLRTGIDLPLGEVDLNVTDNLTEYHEPTGRTLRRTEHFEWRLLKPRR